MFQYVALVSGTTELELTALPYDLVSYGMQIAPLNDNELGPLYADVQEGITIHVTGFTAADAYANVNAVNTLLDQARRWRYGEPVAAVLLRVQAQDASNALDVALLGRPPGGDNPTTLPPTWDESIGRYIIRDVALAFARHGQWLDPDAETGTSTAAANPTVQSIAISTSITRSSPTKLDCMFQNAGAPTLGICDAGIVLTASASNRLQIYEAESGSFGANVASQADAANNARGGAVARYSPGALSSEIGFNLSPAFDTTAQRFAFYAAVRNNSATTTWTIRVQAGAGSVPLTPITPIDASTLNPRIVFLGILNIGAYVDGGGVTLGGFILQLTASAASGTLDIDYVVIQAIDDETSGALSIVDPGALVVAAGTPTTIDHQILTKPTPIVTALQGGGGATVPVPYAGSPVFYTRGSFVATVLGTDAGLWRVCNGTTVLDTLWTATRLPAYLVPE